MVVMDFGKIEAKWQSKWEKSKIFITKDKSKKKKFYCLEMFPYPSAYGLHMGHLRNYSIGDCIARFRRMQGFNVLYPAGYDAFGLPAENAAIKHNIHPRPFTEKAMEIMEGQQRALGLSYDWSRKFATCYPDYYKWNQWIFLKMFEKGLAYKKKAPVNWCDKCQTVLANEQVVNGNCWRHEDSKAEIKDLEQWFFKITDYAEELLEDLNKLEGWPEKIRLMQKNWIGKSEGTMAKFKLKGTNEDIEIFTTRPDTLYGCTFIVLAPEHPKVAELVKGTPYEQKVTEFSRKVLIEEKFSRTDENKEKEGMFIGKYAINPLTNEQVPIYIANFVLMEYGTGAIMAVPAHDQRDFEFAKKYGIEIKVVIQPREHAIDANTIGQAYEGDGFLANSAAFSGMENKKAKEEITNFLEQQNFGKNAVQYKLRDWLISRQRYWGTPIPIIYCSKCGAVPANEKELPVELSDNVKFGSGNPLANSQSFVNAKCPKCKQPGKRETDTMDTFVDSSWYFLRFASAPKTKAFDKKTANQWMPVDQYIGGAEHAVMHLLYARFITKMLRDIGMLKFDEPFINLFNQGMVTKGGTKMSKSKGNVVDPNDIVKKFSADTARFFILFAASPDRAIEWNDDAVESVFNFLRRWFSLYKDKHSPKDNAKDKYTISKTHTLLKEVTEDLDNFKLNDAEIAIMEFTNYLHKYKNSISKKHYNDALSALALVSSPFIPHLAEEAWELLGNKGFISTAKWPKFEKRKISEKLEKFEQLVKKTSQDINEIKKLVGKEPREIRIFVSSKWKYDAYNLAMQKPKELIPQIMKIPEARKSGDIAARFAQDLQRRPVLEKVLSNEEEFTALKESENFLSEEFNCKVIVENSDNSESPKAKRAEPGKPGIELVT